MLGFGFWWGCWVCCWGLGLRFALGLILVLRSCFFWVWIWVVVVVGVDLGGGCFGFCWFGWVFVVCALFW